MIRIAVMTLSVIISFQVSLHAQETRNEAVSLSNSKSPDDKTNGNNAYDFILASNFLRAVVNGNSFPADGDQKSKILALNAYSFSRLAHRRFDYGQSVEIVDGVQHHLEAYICLLNIDDEREFVAEHIANYCEPEDIEREYYRMAVEAILLMVEPRSSDECQSPDWLLKKFELLRDSPRLQDLVLVSATDLNIGKVKFVSVPRGGVVESRRRSWLGRWVGFQPIDEPTDTERWMPVGRYDFRCVVNGIVKTLANKNIRSGTPVTIQF